MSNSSRVVSPRVHGGSAVAGSVATLLVLAVVLCARAGAGSRPSEVGAVSPCEPGASAGAAELPRRWVWARDAIRFDAMFRDSPAPRS